MRLPPKVPPQWSVSPIGRGPYQSLALTFALAACLWSAGVNCDGPGLKVSLLPSAAINIFGCRQWRHKDWRTSGRQPYRGIDRSLSKRRCLSSKRSILYSPFDVAPRNCTSGVPRRRSWGAARGVSRRFDPGECRCGQISASRPARRRQPAMGLPSARFQARLPRGYRDVPCVEYAGPGED